MLNNSATTTTKFCQKILEIDGVINCHIFGTEKSQFLMFCPKKRPLDDYDYLGRFVLLFHALIGVYRTFLSENQFLN